MFLDGQPRPTQSGRITALLNFGFHYIYAYTLCRRTTKFDVVTSGEGPLSLGQPHLPSQESGVSALPSFGGFPVFMHTPFKPERPNSAL